MNEFDLIVRFKSDEDSITLRSYIADHLLEDKLFDNLEMWDFKRSEVLSIVNLRKENAELKAKLNGALDVCNVPEFRINDLEKENAELKKELEKEQNLNKVIKERLVEVNCDCNAEKKEKCVMFPEYCEGERKTVVDLMSLVSDGLNETLIKQKEEQIEVKKLEILELKEELKLCKSVASEMVNKMKNCENCKYFTHKLLNCGNIRICKINPNNIYGVCDMWELPDD